MRKRFMLNKKVALVAIFSAMLFTCTACGADDAEDISGQVTSLENEEDSSIAGSVTEQTTEQTAEQGEAELEDVPVSLGRMQGGTYTNEYAGFACELDSTWEFYTAEELQDIPENVNELFEGTELGEATQQVQQILDMQAECVNDMTGFNVLYQKMSMKDRLAYATMSDDETIELVLSGRDMLEESFAQAGITVAEMSKKTVNFLGEERTGLWTKAKIGDIDYYMLQIFDYSLGQYSVAVTFTSYMEDKTEQVVELFHKL